MISFGSTIQGAAVRRNQFLPPLGPGLIIGKVPGKFWPTLQVAAPAASHFSAKKPLTFAVVGGGFAAAKINSNLGSI